MEASVTDVVRIELILLAVVVASALQFLASLGKPGRGSVLVLVRDSAQRAGVYLAVVIGLEILGNYQKDLFVWATDLSWALALSEFAGAVGLAAQGGGTATGLLTSLAQQVEQLASAQAPDSIVSKGQGGSAPRPPTTSGGAGP
jgi:hypothetical protein